EIKTLLTGPAPPMLHDLMRIAGLSGMRIEEVCSLRVRDLADGLFHVVDAKTAAGIRDVPIHSALAPIVAARTARSRPDDVLFHELPPPPLSRVEDDRRSDPASKAFTRYRRSVGVDERAPGQR